MNAVRSIATYTMTIVTWVLVAVVISPLIPGAVTAMVHVAVSVWSTYGDVVIAVGGMILVPVSGAWTVLQAWRAATGTGKE